MLAIFLFSKMSGPAMVEESYAKEIALMLSAAKPGMEISFGLDEVNDKVDKEWLQGDYNKVVNIISFSHK